MTLRLAQAGLSRQESRHWLLRAPLCPQPKDILIPGPPVLSGAVTSGQGAGGAPSRGQAGPGQVLSGLGWAAFSNFSIRPGHVAPLRAQGCVPCAVDGQTDGGQTAARILSSPCSRSVQTRVQGGPRPAPTYPSTVWGCAEPAWTCPPEPQMGGADGDTHRRCSSLWGCHDA